MLREIAATLMGVGAFIWLIGEMIAVFRSGNSTTDYVRGFMKKWKIVRILVALFTIWFFFHLNFGWWGA